MLIHANSIATVHDRLDQCDHIWRSSAGDTEAAFGSFQDVSLSPEGLFISGYLVLMTDG